MLPEKALLVLEVAVDWRLGMEHRPLSLGMGAGTRTGYTVAPTRTAYDNER